MTNFPIESTMVEAVPARIGADVLAVIVAPPNVPNVANNAFVPLSEPGTNVYGEGNVDSGSDDVMDTVPLKPTATLPRASARAKFKRRFR